MFGMVSGWGCSGWWSQVIFLLSINHVLSLYFINDCVLFMCLAQDSASSVHKFLFLLLTVYVCTCVFSHCVMHFVSL